MTAPPPKPIALALGVIGLGLVYVGCVPIWAGLALIGWGDWRNLPPPFDDSRRRRRPRSIS